MKGTGSGSVSIPYNDFTSEGILLFTIYCPNCKRGLRAPDERGDHRVACPRCDAAFTVAVEAGIVHISRTSVVAQSPEPTRPPVEKGVPPNLRPPINSIVDEDEGSRRTRQIHAAFRISFLGSFAFLLTMCFIDDNNRFGWAEFFTWLPLLLLGAGMLGGAFTVLVAGILTPKSVSGAKRDEALRRKNTAPGVDVLAPRKDDAPQASDHFVRFLELSDVPPKDSPY